MIFVVCILPLLAKLHMSVDSSDVSFVNDSLILNKSLQGLGSNESSQRVIRSFSRGRASGLLHRLVQVNRNDSFISRLGLRVRVFGSFFT